jgi:DNA adenine methylase
MAVGRRPDALVTFAGVTPVIEARPFLKWAGGKRQLLPVLRTYYPRRLAAYHEPFLGSGAVFFDLRASGRLGGVPVWLSDENPDLVGCYLRVRNAVEPVIAELERLAAGHADGGATFYYEVRDRRFNPARAAWAAAGGRPEDYPVELAAALLYLNRTGYNGLFRLNRSGGYNVPATPAPPSSKPTGSAPPRPPWLPPTSRSVAPRSTTPWPRPSPGRSSISTHLTPR